MDSTAEKHFGRAGHAAGGWSIDRLVSVKLMAMKPTETIARFDRHLEERGLSFEAIVVGGAALALLGVISQQTRDCDVLHPAIPGPVADAARAFPRAESDAGNDLDADWLKANPNGRQRQESMVRKSIILVGVDVGYGAMARTAS